MNILSCNKGMALVLTLAILALITAVTIEFVHEVYVNTGFLHNWQTSKRLSLVAKSGVSIASKLLEDKLRKTAYSYPGTIEIPLPSPFSGKIADILFLKIADENSRFNLNTLVHENGEINEEAYGAFRRLLGELELDENITAAVMERLMPKDAENSSRRLRSIDEILLIPGIGSADYEELRPYITVHGSGLININGAEPPVLMALDVSITKEMAERITNYRRIKPFADVSDLQKVAGFKTLGMELIGRITVKGEYFSIHSTASSEDGIIRVVHCVIDVSGQLKYWKEF